jgi:hypothetical protein
MKSARAMGLCSIEDHSACSFGDHYSASCVGAGDRCVEPWRDCQPELAPAKHETIRSDVADDARVGLLPVAAGSAGAPQRRVLTRRGGTAA